MGKRVIITLMEGSFEQGFPAILRISGDDGLAETEIQGKLPPAPSILELFNDWQLAYRHLVLPHCRIRPLSAQVTNFSCRQLGDELDKRLNDWLNSGTRDWQRIRDKLQRSLSETEEIQVIIQTENIQLRRLPWHLWDLFSNHYTKAEIALSSPEYKSLGKTTPLTNKVRILAILGDSTGIDVQKDREMLKQLPNAEILFLEEPQRQELYNQLWEQQWEIIFFAGHSFSGVDGDTGKIYINSTDSLSIVELKNALRRAVEGGLQLAIFNSCDGLGLAQELADLHIPQIILMREPVPDLVAQEFLKYFLRSFAQGKSLYLAVREARERLQSLEEKFPFGSWLPVIFQNPAEVPLSWQNLFRKTISTHTHIHNKCYQPFLLLLIVLASFFQLNTLRFTMLYRPSDSTYSTVCLGKSCIGRDPIENKCDIDAETITSTLGKSRTSEGRLEAFTIELRYSKRCSSTWVRTTGPSILGAIDYLEDRQGKRYSHVVVPKNGILSHYGDMGPGNIEIKACVQPLDGKLACTDFVKPGHDLIENEAQL